MQDVQRFLDRQNVAGPVLWCLPKSLQQVQLRLPFRVAILAAANGFSGCLEDVIRNRLLQYLSADMAMGQICCGFSQMLRVQRFDQRSADVHSLHFPAGAGV